MDNSDQRLIERGFPCHQVGAETQRERGSSSALPPLYFLHVWWARRPLIPSRAAIIASLDRADTDPETFVCQLGIGRVQALIHGEPWTLTGDLLQHVEVDASGAEVLLVDDRILRALHREDERRAQNRELIAQLLEKDPSFTTGPVLTRWDKESTPLPQPWPRAGEYLFVRRVMGDPAHVNARIEFARSEAAKAAIGREIKWAPEDLYGYNRAFTTNPTPTPTGITILDPTAGGGSIPLEALRLGHTVIANELNPVAAVILHATLDYPTRFGLDLLEDIQEWGKRLLHYVEQEMAGLAPFSPLPEEERARLRETLRRCPEILPEFDVPEFDHIGLIYARQVACPHCGGEAPLLNTCWLSKEAGDPWGVRISPDGKARGGKVTFQTYRVIRGRGPNGEDPNMATVARGVGQCVHCKQAIPEDEIKSQARGESQHGRWTDRLYSVAAIRLEPLLDRHGQPQRYTSALKEGEIKTRKVHFFRPPNDHDLQALQEAEKRLQQKWPELESAGLIPSEEIPPRSNYNRGHRLYGMLRWCDLFSRMTRWEFTRGIVKGTFGSHNFSLKWTFGEMIFTGPNSGAAWGLSQVVNAYRSLAELLKPINAHYAGDILPLTILNDTAAHMPSVADSSIDLVCMDPPYYDNVQYGEISDYFYVWQRRTLADLYPDLFRRRLVDKISEAVANPARDGSAQSAKATYQRMMGEIFAECQRVLKDDGILTLMFTHKSQEAWEALTRSLIEAGWNITASFPVESEATESIHLKNTASAASSIFLACRKRSVASAVPALWTGLAGRGVQQQIRSAVKEALAEFVPLHLTPVDETVAAYGRALRVLSQHWPVMDGNERVSPIRAMNEASRVVAEHQIARITRGRLAVEDLDPETAMALTLYGISGLKAFAYDEALNLSRSLNIALSARPGGYHVEGRMIGINQEAGGQRSRSRGAASEDIGYHAPLVRKGSKLRLALPDERHPRRMAHPQTDWDILHGLILAYRRGEIPVARAYLEEHAPRHQPRILDLLDVWAAEMTDPNLKRETETLRFGLRPMAA